MEAIDLFKSYLQQTGLFEEQEIVALDDHLKVGKLKKGDFFIREGEVAKRIGFITKGVIRSYYLNSKMEEVTYCFRFPLSFMTAYSSLISGNSSVENFQAITDMEYCSLSKEAMKMLENKYVSWLSFMKIAAEHEYISLEGRIFQLQTESAKKRYMDLLKNHPDYVLHIPLNYLASYLGISQRHLSRIRNQV